MKIAYIVPGSGVAFYHAYIVIDLVRKCAINRKNGRASVNRLFGIENTAKKIIKLYESCIIL